MVQLLADWHWPVHPLFFADAVIGLPDESKRVIGGAICAFAKQCFVDHAHDVSRVPINSVNAAWAMRMAGRTEDIEVRDRELSQALMTIYDPVRPQAKSASVPRWYDPRLSFRAERAINISIRQEGEFLVLEPKRDTSDDLETSGESSFGTLRSRNEIVVLGDVQDAIDNGHDYWHAGRPPAWASAWGQDRYGRYAEFKVENVIQRMRWIEPGRFLMGSPEDEEGRWDDEGPQHDVTITTGFWLFDTPCTQDLWDAVLGKNANKCQFKGPRRPVESVDWHVAVAFTEKLNAVLPGLGLRLPREAEWEYACRAGTTTPRYGKLDDVAWQDATTHDVGQKLANACGLFDMLGNVDEWCADAQRTYMSEPVTDPDGGSGALRVFRGGSWANTARVVRAAYRNSRRPGHRYGYLGFRPLSSGDQPSQAGEPRSGVWRAEPVLGAERPAPEAQKISIFVRDRVSHPLPAGKPFQLESDCERLVFDVIAKPEWAEAIGRDKHGLWTTLQVKDAVQKLRWIPPGRFLMGSPQSEEGRFDDEGPVHPVVISHGYWLFDTPCCQDLWEAVLGAKANESRFRSPRRPVENLDWDQAVSFAKRLSELKPGLHLRLPREAEWEYACRAGTLTTTFGGEIRIEGENNAPVLDAIAWYGGNSGLEFDLADGHDSSEWKEKQFQHNKAGTRFVGMKKPNAWGLYDMLGNVWEWCRDSQREYTIDLVTDPDGSRGAGRVIRGGGWADSARSVRAAYRVSARPGDRSGDLGFRPLSSGIREEEEVEPVREAAGAAERSKAASGAIAKNSDFAAVLGEDAEPNAGVPPKRPKKPRK